MITKENFKNLLETLGFSVSKNIYSKKFQELDCLLEVDFTNEELIFPEELIVNDATTSNFSSPENFVVFECVHRLLTQGYHPSHIELEKKWQLGHTQKSGKADIYIKDNDANALLIIECKTAGQEYKKAINILESDVRNQLFSYLQQATTTQFLALYTSDFIDARVKANYYLINVTDNEELLTNNPKLQSFKEASTTEEKYQVWSQTYDKEYATLGLFEENAPYEIGKRKFNIRDLQPVSSQDIQEKYNQFATILRKYNVSGRENAFDKLINLFLCKVVDETQNAEELKFYWKGKAYDNPFDFQDRLQQLYKDGMKKFLGEDITYIDNKKIDTVFHLYDLDTIKRDIKEILKEQKFFTNNDFAFVDVHNEKLFYQNFRVLLDIARLIQDINLTSSDENQFLGDMFEGFLDQGVKQSEGQFFTPMPIVKFIIHSLPEKEQPKVIDYACGAGHFLNEYFTLNKESKIIGVEKEYRLSKVAKVSSFMYGSNINIIYNDALASNDAIKEGDYDMLIANPPYSVKGFLETLSLEDKERFSLIKSIDEKSYRANNAIECFFIERAKELLTSDGVAGIIVPSSILNKGSQNIYTEKQNVYVATREILLQYFEIVAIAEFGSGTFGKTGTNTVTLFLKRRCDTKNLAGTFYELAEKIFSCHPEFEDSLHDKEMVQKYCEHIEVDYEIYKSLLCDAVDAQIFTYDIFQEYKTEFEKLTITKNRKKRKQYKALEKEQKEAIEQKELLKYMKLIEKEKFYYYALAYKNSSDVIIVKSPSNSSENKKFLGYEWSSAKGNEGIHYITKSTIDIDDANLDEEDRRILGNLQGLKNINTPLYNPQNSDDANKINKIIKDNFNAIQTPISDELKQYVTRAKLVDMLDFSRVDFNKNLSLTPTKRMEIESKYPLEKIENLIIENSKSKIKVSDAKESGGIYPFFTSGENIYKYDTYLVDSKNIYLSTGGNAVIKYYDGKASYSTDTFSIKTNTQVKIEYLYEFLLSIVQYINEFLFEGIGLKHLQKNDFKNMKIPLPPLQIQEQIVKECQAVDNTVREAEQSIEKTKKEIENEIDSVDARVVKIGEITSKIGSGATPKGGESSYKKSGITLIRSQNIYDDGFHVEGLAFIDEEQAQKLDNVTIKENDVLFNITGASVARCSIVPKEFLPARVNQHVAIIRAKENILSQYLQKILTSDAIKKDFIAIAKSSSTREAITKSEIENFKIPLPPLATQKQIIAKIEALEIKINKAKEIIKSAKDKKEEILRRYL